MTNTLKINEVFYSLQGESSTIGLPTVFIRLSGCPIRCSWCDTDYAFKGGSVISIDDLIASVNTYKTKNITITGGEPLAQARVQDLIVKLCDAQYKVSIETGGMMDVSIIDKRATIVMDIKAPGSGEQESTLWSNLNHLKKEDEIKAVLKDYADYQWLKEVIEKYNLYSVCNIIVSPVFEEISPTELANWVIADELQVRFQVQLHKILWGEEKGK